MSLKIKFIVLTLTLLVSTPLYADDHQPDNTDGLLFLTSIGFGSLSLTGGAIGGGLTTTNSQQQAPVHQVVYFLKQNKTDFRAALQMGSGPVLEDFSRLIGFTDVESKAVAKLLRKNRKFVNEKAIKNLTMKNAEVLLNWIQNEMA